MNSYITLDQVSMKLPRGKKARALILNYIRYLEASTILTNSKKQSMAQNTNSLICNVKGHGEVSYATFNDLPTLLITCKECGKIFVVEDAAHINELKPFFDAKIFARLKERMELW